MTIEQIHQGYSNGTLTPTQVVSDSLKKIHAGKKLNAFVTIRDEAIDEVKNLPPYSARYPLWGIPVSVKDNFNMKGVVTTASSNVLASYVSPYDATVVARLRDAGAIIVGKTNMDAWAHGSSTETSDFGPSRNPHNTDYMPGGSSGGAAVSVASGMVPVAIGSETAGSIRQPAGWCGVIGLKPSYGRVSRYGLIAMASSTDSPGVIATSVADAERTLSVIAGHDPYDATSLKDTMEKGSYAHLKIGWSKSYLNGASKGTITAFTHFKETIEKLGHSLHEVELIDPKYAIAVYTVVQRAEVASNLARFDGIRFGGNRSLFGSEAKKRILLGNYVLSVGYFDAYYLKAQKVRTKIIENFNQVFESVDLLISPVSPTPALKIGESSKYPYFGELMDVLVEPSSIAGLPGIALPVGFEGDLPLGMQIVAPMKQEMKMISLSQELESRYQFTQAISHGF